MAFMNNPAFSPENLLMLSGNVLAGQNFASGLGTGLQQLGANVTAQQKEQAERQRQLQETAQMGNYLRKQAPGTDLSAFTPEMMKMAASTALQKQLNPAAPEFKVLPDGSYGTWNGSSFNKLGVAQKPADLPAAVQEYEYAKNTQGFKGTLQDWQEQKAKLDDGKTSDRFKTELDTMKTYRGEDAVKTFQATRDAFEKVRSSSQLSTAQGDIGLIFGFMKMLDPTSVVREGEFATAQNSGGIDETVYNIYNKALNGERLTPEQRQKFVEAAQAQYENTAKNIEGVNTRYQGLADAYDIPSERFLEKPKEYPPLKLGAEPTSVVLPDGTQGTIRRTK